MKQLLLIICVVLCSLTTFGQGYVTKDTTFGTYLARISYIPGKTDSTNLILVMHGNGEAGTTTNNSQTYGPHYWLNNGWDGGIVLGNGTHYPVYVTLQQPALYTRPWNLKTRIDAIKTRFKVKYGGLHAMGLSGGGWCWQQVATYKPTSTDYSYYSIFRSLVNIQGVMSDDTYDATIGWPAKFGNAAKVGGLRYVGFEQVGDNRNISAVVKNINDSIAGRGFMYFTNFGGSNHCCFNDYYNPSQTNWTLTNADVQLSNGASINTTPFTGGQNIYQWALRQSADTSITTVGALAVNAGSSQTIALPTNSVTLSGSASGGTPPYTYTWTKLSGTGSTITSSSSASTTVTGLSVGSYSYQLQVNDVVGAATGTTSVTVNYSSADLSISSNSVTINDGQTAALTSTTSPNHNIVSTQWTKLSPTPKTLKLAFIGSSTTAGFGTTGYTSGGVNDSSYATRVLKYYQNLGIISTITGVNLGVSSTDIFDGQPSWYVPSGSQHSPLSGKNITAALALNPDVVFVCYPTNSYDFLSVAEVMAAHRRIKATADSAGVTTFFSTTMPRPPFSPTEELKLRTIRDSIIAQFPSNYIDFYTPMEKDDEEMAVVPAYAYGDGVHFNDAGHRQLFNKFVAANVFKGFVTSTSSISTPTTNNTNITSAAVGSHRFQVSITDARGLSANSISTVTVNAVSNCNGAAPVTYVLSTTSAGEIYRPNLSAVKGGDTLKVPAGTYSVIELGNFGGDECRPVFITNSGGLVNITGALRLKTGVKHVILDGGGHSGLTYGFKAATGAAVEGAHHVVFRKVEVMNSGGVGIYVKLDPVTGQPLTQHPNFFMTKITIDSCYLHDIAGEGMYVGNTAPNGDPYNDYLIPVRLDSVTISNNTVLRTGWDGIQLSNARNDARIYGNYVKDYGLLNGSQQQAGIIIGGNTTGRVYNNKVIKGTGNGIQAFGFGTISIYNNFIDSAGIDNQQSIYTNDNANTVEANPGLNLNIYGNTIYHRETREAIKISNGGGTATPSTVHDNNFLIPGATIGWQALEIIMEPSGGTEYNNNLLSENIEVRHYLIRKRAN